MNSGDHGTLETMRLVELVRRCQWLSDALAAGRSVGAGTWAIGAGAVRDLVFEHLHGRSAEPPPDVDFVFFEPFDPSVAREQAIEEELGRRCPDLRFDFANQARVHLWYEDHFGSEIAPYRSLEHAISTWPESATAVAVRLRADDGIDVIAPLGLDDLFAGILRRNPVQVTPEIFAARLARRPDLAERWPLVRVIRE